MELYQVIRLRKSIRSYQPRIVDDEKIKKVLEAARLAPSWKNMQCWRFIVVKDFEKIREIAKTKSADPNYWLAHVPTLIVVCADPHNSGYQHEQYYYLVDTAIALEHLMLEATDLGLGTCWVCVFDERRIKELLKIPPRIKVVALTPLGYPTEVESWYSKATQKMTHSKERKPLEEISSENTWGRLK